MLIQKVDGADIQPLQRGFHGLLDVLGAAVQTLGMRVCGVVELEAELGGDDDLIAKRREGFADEFFVDEWAVDLSCVEKRDAAFDCAAHDGDHFLFGSGDGAVTGSHAHAAETDGRYFEAALAEFTGIHN